jgi:hypothetical protein
MEASPQGFLPWREGVGSRSLIRLPPMLCRSERIDGRGTNANRSARCVVTPFPARPRTGWLQRPEAATHLIVGSFEPDKGGVATAPIGVRPGCPAPDSRLGLAFRATPQGRKRNRRSATARR